MNDEFPPNISMKVLTNAPKMGKSPKDEPVEAMQEVQNKPQGSDRGASGGISREDAYRAVSDLMTIIGIGLNDYYDAVGTFITREEVIGLCEETWKATIAERRVAVGLEEYKREVAGRVASLHSGSHRER